MNYQEVTMESSGKIQNVHGVAKRQWKKWDKLARYVFNETYELMINNQGLFKHPKDVPSDLEMWKTTAWNAAWIAADNVRMYKRENV
jgi:hypothetical protein